MLKFVINNRIICGQSAAAAATASATFSPQSNDTDNFIDILCLHFLV